MEPALAPQEIGVRLFRKEANAGAAVVEEVTLDPESGLFPVEYGEIGRALHGQGAAAFQRTRALEE